MTKTLNERAEELAKLASGSGHAWDRMKKVQRLTPIFAEALREQAREDARIAESLRVDTDAESEKYTFREACARNNGLDDAAAAILAQLQQGGKANES